MKLAVKKEPGSVPGGGYHYMLMPIKFDGINFIPEIWELMGHIIIEVPEEQGERLLKETSAALRLQYEVAVITEKTLEASNAASNAMHQDTN